MGKHYYDAARVLYGDDNSPASRMRVLNPDEPADQVVSAAITALTQHRADRDPMNTLFTTDYVPNQKSLVAMFRSVCDLQPRSNTSIADFFIDMLSYIVRNGLHTKHKHIFDLLRPKLDAALERHWIAWKSSGLSASLWFDLHEPYMDAIVDKAAMQRCFGAKQWSDVADDLGIVVQTATGARIFLPKYTSVFGHALVQKVQTECKSSLAIPNITQADVVKVKGLCEAHCKAAGKNLHDVFDLPMEINIVYRGIDIKVLAKSYSDVFNVTVFSIVKTRAVNVGELQSLWCENDLVVPESETNVSVDPALIRSAKLARRAATGILGDEKQTGQTIMDMLTSKSSMLAGMDKDWTVEQSFFLGMVGDAGEAQLRAKLLGCLPASDKSVAI